MIPMIYEGNGKFSASSIYHKMRCEKMFGAGQEITFEELGDRNMNRHRMYFARLKELWLTLPESMAEDFPSPEVLRKHALIRCGYATMRKFSMANADEASALERMLSELESYAVCEITAPVVGSPRRILAVWVPQSQAVKNMGKSEFDKSVTDVLDYCERLVRSEPGKVIPFGRRE